MNDEIRPIDEGWTRLASDDGVHAVFVCLEVAATDLRIIARGAHQAVLAQYLRKVGGDHARSLLNDLNAAIEVIENLVHEHRETNFARYVAEFDWGLEDALAKRFERETYIDDRVPF